MQSLPANPFIPDRPARDPQHFFGRADVVEWISARFGQHAMLVVHGPPRIGLTSLLWQVCNRLNGQYQTFYLSCDNGTVFSAMQQVARTVSTALGIPQTDSPQALRQALTDGKFDVLRPPVLIALDDITGFELRTKTELLNALGQISVITPQVRFMLAWGLLEDESVSRDMPLRLIGLTENLAPVAQTRVSALTRAESSELVMGTAGTLLKFDFNALERIWQESNGRPAALQMIGFAVYERRALSGRVSTRDVELAINDAISRLATEMSEQWGSLNREEQLTLAAAATVRGEHGLLTAPMLSKELKENHFTLSPIEALGALARLAQLDILEPAGVQAFRFSSGLVRDWAIQYANLAAVTGKPLRPSVMARGFRTRSIGQTLLRTSSWILLFAFVIFVAIGGAQFVQGFSPAPTPTVVAAAQATPSRTPVPLPSPTAVPRDVMAYMFRKTDKDKWRIYVSGPEGTNPTPITNGLADDQWPVWSPDGARIAFTSNRNNHYEVYVMNPDGSDQVRMTRTGTHSWSPTWSPDGKKLLFSTFRDRNWEVYTENADGSQPTRLTDDPAEDNAPSWSPDGRAIAFASKRTGNYEIYLMNPDGSSVTRLTQTNANNYSPAWTADGRRLAFESNRDGNWEVYVMDGDGTNAKNLTNNSANDQGPVWSPDGSQIAFYSNRNAHTDIYTMSSDGGDPINWTRGAGIAQFPSWKPAAKGK